MDAQWWVEHYSGWLLSEGKNPDDDVGTMTRTGSQLAMDTVDPVDSGHVGSVAATNRARSPRRPGVIGQAERLKSSGASPPFRPSHRGEGGTWVMSVRMVAPPVP